jgi:hypothetical protein
MSTCPVHGEVDLVTEEVFDGWNRTRIGVVESWSCGCLPAMYEFPKAPYSLSDVVSWYTGLSPQELEDLGGFPDD